MGYRLSAIGYRLSAIGYRLKASGRFGAVDSERHARTGEDGSPWAAEMEDGFVRNIEQILGAQSECGTGMSRPGRHERRLGTKVGQCVRGVDDRRRGIWPEVAVGAFAHVRDADVDVSVRRRV